MASLILNVSVGSYAVLSPASPSANDALATDFATIEMRISSDACSFEQGIYSLGAEISTEIDVRLASYVQQTPSTEQTSGHFSEVQRHIDVVASLGFLASRKHVTTLPGYHAVRVVWTYNSLECLAIRTAILHTGTQ